MSFSLIFTDSYKKRASRFAKQHPELKAQYQKTLLLLAENPHHPSLPALVTLEMVITEQEIILVNVGAMMKFINHDYSELWRGLLITNIAITENQLVTIF